ncbi:hypothetical protein Acor_79760 [Acrocarpospora corrugata]|uniref:Uncharacterized protein n=1 Tax=Acrocarpospora corrugata TaxID=35763 RepID=A0A5M3WA11_9ACTN|nr:hypothetical protein [Acrocarpospora corrugata]GES05907.1 hypothetical protein Acor_79760 [Acrocarpospora corrugata]
MSRLTALIIAGLVSAVLALCCYILSVNSGMTPPSAILAAGGAFLAVATLTILVLEYLR